MLSNGSLTVILPILSGIAAALLCFFYCRCALPERGTVEWIHAAVQRPQFENAFSRGRLTALDAWLIVCACVLYALLSAASLLYCRLSGAFSAGGALTFGSAQPLWSAIAAALSSLFGSEGALSKIPGVIFGTLTVALSGVFMKMLCKSSLGTFFSLLTLIFGGIFFTVCGIDAHASFSALLIVATFFTMYLYITSDDDASPAKTLIPALLCGLIFGLGCAVTPQMALSAPGLIAALLFALIVRGVPGVRSSDGKRILMLVGSFIVLPAAAYAAACLACGAHFPQELSRFLAASDAKNILLLKRGFLGLTPDVFFRAADSGKHISVSALRNPLVCVSSVMAIIILIQRTVKHRDSGALFILFALMTTLLPAALFGGTSADCVIGDIFAVPALSFVFAALFERKRRGSTAFAIVFAVMTVFVFALYFPVLAGIPVKSAYTDAFLAWFPCWHF